LRKILPQRLGRKLYNALNDLPTVKTFEQAIEDDKDHQNKRGDQVLNYRLTLCGDHLFKT